MSLFLNRIEQDHHFIKRRVKPGLRFASYQTTWQTLQSNEAMNMIRKEQVTGADKNGTQALSSFRRVDVEGEVKPRQY